MPSIHIERWMRGLVTNRAATSMPFRFSSLGQPIVFHDALIDGSNVEISPANTLVRRPGWSKYCSASFGSETPKGFTSAIINGTLYKFLNTDQNVYVFDTSSLTSVYSKATTAQSFFQQVGNILYFSDGAANKKFTVGSAGDTHVTNAGVAAPPAAPTIPNLNLHPGSGTVSSVPSLTSAGATNLGQSLAWKFKGSNLPQGSGLTVSFKAGTSNISGTGLTITAASIIRTAAGSAPGSTALQVLPLTFGGSSTITVGTGATATSDFASIVVSPLYDYWIIMYNNGSALNIQFASGTFSSSDPQPYSQLNGDQTAATTISASWNPDGTTWRALSALSVTVSQSTHAWVPNATYTNNATKAQNYFLLAPTGEIQWAVIPAGTTLQSQSSAPNWAANFGVFGSTTKDGSMVWTNCGPELAWKATTAFTNSTFVSVSQQQAVAALNTATTSGSTSVNWTVGSTSAGINPSTGTTGNSNTLKFTNLGLAVPSGATITGVQVTAQRGTNRANAVSDVTVQLLKAGSATGSNKALGGFWPQTLYNVYTIPTTGQGVSQLYGSNTDLWGTTLTPSDVNNSGFGVEFVVNQGSTRTTTAALVFPLTITVFYTIAGSDITGTVYAQIVADSNGNLQRVLTGGTSGSSTPSWSTTIGGQTSDGSVTWECLGTANQLPCLFSRTYASSFHTSSPHTSTLSPLLVVQAPIIGLNVPLQGFGSDDTQVDSNDLYRTADGGSLLLYDTSTSNVGSTTAWSITDTALDSDLNFEIIGPVADANDPPPVGMTLLAYHMGRLWGVVGNLLYYSAGPDCINGDGNQAWPPANVFTLDGPINSIKTTSAGLVVLTANERSIILGGPQANTFWLQPLLKGRGVQSPNCVDQDGDEIASFTSSQQFFGVSSAGENEFGFDVADLLASTFAATTSYVAIHRSGQDQGIFISDGSSKIHRYNLNSNSWDTLAAPANGIGPISSIDTVIGTRTLVSAAGGFIVFRDLSTYSDAGTAYPAFATVGSLVLSEPGEPPMSVKTFVVTSKAVGTDPTVSVLPNEISGSFTSIPFNAADPPQLVASSTLHMRGFAWLGVASQLVNYIKHLQVKLTLATEAVKNEIFTLSVINNVQSSR